MHTCRQSHRIHHHANSWNCISSTQIAIAHEHFPFCYTFYSEKSDADLSHFKLRKKITRTSLKTKLSSLTNYANANADYIDFPSFSPSKYSRILINFCIFIASSEHKWHSLELEQETSFSGR